VLVVLLDLASAEGRTPTEQEEVLLGELGDYQPQLLDRPRVVVGSRADVAGDTTAAAGFDGLRISAVTHEGLDELLGQLAVVIDEARAAEPEPESFLVHRPKGEGFAVTREDDGGWRVVGRDAERAVAMADLTNQEALLFVQQRLRRMGVDRALARAGVRQGDVVRIGGVEMEYERDSMEGGGRRPEGSAE
jgi:GTP-binding protein